MYILLALGPTSPLLGSPLLEKGLDVSWRTQSDFGYIVGEVFLIEHHGDFINSDHYVSYIRQNYKWYHCDDKRITETNLLTLSNNIYLCFMLKRSI